MHDARVCDQNKSSLEASISALAPMRHAIFRAVWVASLASNLGGLIQSVGASWLMASIAGSAEMVGLVHASTTLPIMLFSLAAGAVADNYDRRIVMLTAQVFLCVVSVALAACTYLGLITPYLLLVFTFLIGCGTALNNPSWQAAVGDMVPRSDLTAAITLNSMSINLARSVGPALGGMIVAAAGAAAAFAVNALSYISLIIVLFRWRPRRPEPVLPPEPFGAAMASGLRYVAMSPTIGDILLRGAAFGLAAGAIQALMPLVARDVLQGGPVTFGVLLGAFGAGAVCGALSSGWLRRAIATEAIIRMSFLGSGICAVVAAVSSATWMTVPAMALGGACWVTAMSTFNGTIQLSVPRWVVGRTLSIYQAASFGGMAFGGWMWGRLAEETGTTDALLVAALAHAIGMLIGLLRPVPNLELINLDPLVRRNELPVKLDVQPRSGPVVITVEYIIGADDIARFLSLMAERRRVRRRDGARHWTLLRDVANPELWIERYHTQTWLDYIRHKERMIHADAIVGERLRKLHQGPEPPTVRHMVERQVDASSSHLPGYSLTETLTNPTPTA
jgi:MFS family permease